MSRFIDLTGQKFNRLTVLKRADDYISPKGQHKLQWLCKCDCGNEIIVQGNSLKNGVTKSCGCLNKELTSNRFKKYNAYDLSGEYGVGYTAKGEEFWFDLEDYDLIKDYCWYINSEGYVRCRDVFLHRLIMNPCNHEYVDHIRHKKYDNRKSELRIVTQSQNNINRETTTRNSSSFVGVSFCNTKNKWRAYITYQNKTLNLGFFDNFENAVDARVQAEEKYFGEYSYSNSIR